jgi:TolB-like protein/Flp pilus assembly protein TadD
MKSYQQFFAELKRRHVFKVTGIYGIVAFGVLQVADIALPRLGLPDWTVTFMLAVILLAFPVVLIIAWAFEVTPEGVKKTDAAAPGEIEAIVAAPMSQRWPIGLLGLVGVVALLGGGWWIGRSTAPGASQSTEAPAGADVRLAMTDFADDDRASIAVLPFADMSAAQDQEYFGDGMTEEILNTLAKIRELRVAGRTSAFAYKGQNKDLREIGAELGVAYIVEGSVRKESDDLRITAQLIDAADGSHLWSDSYDRPLANVFEIQREIAEAIAEELRIPLGLESEDLVQPTADLEAYDLYLAGRGRVRLREDQLDEAVEFFEAAIVRDPTWAPAWAGLAEAQELSGWWPESWESEPADRDEYRAVRADFWQEAEESARRALELDPDNSSALVALGSVLRNRFDWEASEEAYLQALARDPDNPEAYQQYGTMLLEMGRTREGRRATARAAILDRAPVRALWHAVGLYFDGEFDEAIGMLEDADQDLPSSFLEANLISMYLTTGRFQEAAARLGLAPEFASRLQGGDPSSLSQLDPRYANDPAAWLAIGLRDSALAAVDRRVLRLTSGPSWVWHPGLDPIRGEPEMQSVMRSFNLEGRTPDRTPR